MVRALEKALLSRTASLIAAGDLPVMVAVFVEPGTIDGNSNRSFEYDNLSGDYAQLIIDELLPQVAADHGIDFSDAPEDAEVLPLRVSLLSGTNDLDNQFGSWRQANIDMAAALAERGYHYRFVHGEGSHNPDHAGAVMPDTLRWLWREPLVEG